MPSKQPTIAWFRDIIKEDIPLVGGKGANLGEMTRAGFPVPSGFVVTTDAYYEFLRENNLTTKIHHLLGTANFDKPESLQQVSAHIKKLILEATPSPELVTQLFKAYKQLGGVFQDALVAVRSSATTEDLATASFAGQQETYLNIKGEANVLLAVKEAWASLFETRAMVYRREKRVNHFRIGIAAVIQLMVESEKSGVMFTRDPVTNNKSVMTIEAIFGLGEYLVRGVVTPDHYEVTKQPLTIQKKVITYQEVMLKKVGTQTKEQAVSSREGKEQKITDQQIIELATIGKKLEQHYYFPQDVEWAIAKNKLYIVQTRPITTPSPTRNESFSKPANLPQILSGTPVSPGIATGPVKIVSSEKEFHKIIPGDIVVTSHTNPALFPMIKKAAAIITTKATHSFQHTMFSQRNGVPTVIGEITAIKSIKPGQVVTVNGSTGLVYKGSHEAARTSSAVQQHTTNLVSTATKIYIDITDPKQAEKVSQKLVDGVGLLHVEPLLKRISMHPKLLLKEGKQQEIIDTLTKGIEQVCTAFAPRPVIYRVSDATTTEYRMLIGGKEFEPIESNPLLGYHGAYRAMHDAQVFELELAAIKYLRNKRGLKNLWLQIPFVRSVKELIEVKKLINASGLYRSPTFKIYMMVEIPANVFLLDRFIEVGIDGVTINTDTLTTLMLGTDQENAEVSSEYDEQNDALLWAVEKISKTAHKYGIATAVCGQAPSKHLELLEKLIEHGITSISVNPEASDHVRQTIIRCEKSLMNKKKK